MTKEEIEKLEKRIYELRDKSIIAIKKKDFSNLKKYGKELKEINKKLKKAMKECKNEKRN